MTHGPHTRGAGTNERDEIVDPTGALAGKRAGTLDERDHELRSALCGIEAVAHGLNCQHERLDVGAADRAHRRPGGRGAPAPWVARGQHDGCDHVRSRRPIAPVLASVRATGQRRPLTIPRDRGRGRHDARRRSWSRCSTTPASTPRRLPSTCGRPCSTAWSTSRRGSGTGIRQRVVRRVRARRARRRSAGTGLGLHIARRLMTDQGGSIAVRPVAAVAPRSCCASGAARCQLTASRGEA